MASTTWHVVSQAELRAYDQEMKDVVADATEEGWTGRFATKGNLIMRAPDGQTTMSVSVKAGRGRSDKNVRAQFERWKKTRPGASMGVTADQTMPMLETGDHAALQHVVQSDERILDYMSSLINEGADTSEVSRRMAIEVNHTDPHRQWVVFDRTTYKVVSWGEGIASEEAAYIEVFGDPAESPYVEPTQQKQDQQGPEKEQTEKEQPAMTKYKCTECGEQFSTSHHLAAHSKRHKPRRQCVLCGQWVKYMDTHLRRQHGQAFDPDSDDPQVYAQPVDEEAFEESAKHIRRLMEAATLGMDSERINGVLRQEIADLEAENASLKAENEEMKTKMSVLREAMSL